MDLNEIKQKATGNWESIAIEIRPSQAKNADGSLKAFYLTRQFTLNQADQFTLTLTNYADPFGKTALARLFISGHVRWQGEHPIAPGAQKVDFIADTGYEVTPLLQAFAFVLNQSTSGFDEWRVNETQSILKKGFPPFALKHGDIFQESDLIYLTEGLMFWGARHVDGRGFDSEENRPTNLQVPLKRIKP